MIKGFRGGGVDSAGWGIAVGQTCGDAVNRAGGSGTGRFVEVAKAGDGEVITAENHPTEIQHELLPAGTHQVEPI